ncbi:TIR domain-containing protein [Sulfurimonas diazotrophicus]|uniref:TIR domain-containing protein n=1 Tax=Sulfurimonas diazotrophicus TaxID=3131939 RepID=A0ABZ3HCY0_9BACT
MQQLVEEVFVTEGIPKFTFVKPPNFNEILLDIRHPGKPVIIEGQSGTGKTTCVRKILEQLGGEAAEYLTARDATNIHRIEEIIRSRAPGRFVIDDFHRLATETQEQLANIAKFAAESGQTSTSQTKLVLIGINQVGSELIQLVPDIAKRTGIHRIQAGSKVDIERLIKEGSAALNVDIPDVESVFKESRGDYWLTQQLCQTICIMNDVLETLDNKRELSFDIALLRKRVVERLSAAFYPAVKEFCRGVRFRPNNDPYLKLLQKISQQESSIVDLNELANSNEDIRGSINNIKGSRLAILLRDKPTCARHFYYNAETTNFAIEDPALFYFLKHLDWAKLRHDCGFRAAGRDVEYDFAVSFAGENRELAREIAQQLSLLDAHVFYDEHFEANFLGGAWSTQFERIFGSDSRLVVCLLDNYYREKIWPTFERECFLPRVPDGDVIPIFLDDTTFVGIPKDIIGIHFKRDENPESESARVTDEIAFKLIERLG